jgi:chromosomal replication initiator protein
MNNKDVRQEYIVESIIETVTTYYNITEKDITSKSRKREFVTARHITTMFLRKFTKISLKDIGLRLGGRDHTTAINSLKVINDLLETDDIIKEQCQEIIKLISNKKIEIWVNSANCQ